MPSKSYLIVNADDFGQSPGVNRGILAAREHGIVTSASLMVRWTAAAEAAAYGRAHSAFSVGLHVDLSEWAYRDGTWVPSYQVVPMDNRDAVEEEVRRQLAAFRRLMGQDPTHIDSHQHVHHVEPACSVLVELARELAAPLRHFCPAVHYCGSFYGQAVKGYPYPEGIRVGTLIETLKSLPPGVTELGCHPGEGDDVDSMYRGERADEVKTLCDPRVRAALDAEGIELGSFRDLAAGGRWNRTSTWSGSGST
jgi:predicted glycoside hydrolase/deacetylase ChbG (UPF0249 family)